MDILRLVEKQHNMTTGGLYCANQVYDGGADIPVIETVDDYGLVVSLYETSFEATNVVLATNKTIMSEEEAVFTVEAKIDECYKEENVVGGKGDLFVNYFVGSEFITKIQHDKELQKALLVLIGESK